MLASPLSTRILGLILIALILGAVVFAATASYARKETVQGWVTPEGGLIRVAARQGGVVETVHIREGDAATAMTPLVTLKLSSDLDSGDTGKALAGDLAAEGVASAALTRASLAKLRIQRDSMATRLNVLRRELAETQHRVTILERRQAIAEASVGRAEKLLAQGFLSKAGVDTARSSALAAAQETSATRAVALDLERQINDLTHDTATASSDVAMLEAQGAQSRAVLSQRWLTAQAQSTFVATAPIDGRVITVPVERGQTVAAGAAVAMMVPKGSMLTVELYVPSRAAGFIRPGQPVRIMYQAFPYQTFGAGHGVVRSVSSTVLAPSEVAIPGLTMQEPVFRVRVALDRQSVAAYGRVVSLRPGMLLSADIVIERRTLIQWLLDPLYAVGRRA